MISKILTVYRSLLFCFRFLPWRQAIHVPIHVLKPIRCHIRGKIILDFDYRTDKVYLGGYDSHALPSVSRGTLWIENGAQIVLHGGGVIAEGTGIRADKDSRIDIGTDFFINKNCFLRSEGSISIGDHCVMGWNAVINTTDGHDLYIDNQRHPASADIHIGNHVWIAQNVTIGKGCLLGNGIVVAQHSLVTKSFTKEKCLIGGVPAKILKEGVEWAK